MLWNNKHGSTDHSSWIIVCSLQCWFPSLLAFSFHPWTVSANRVLNTCMCLNPFVYYIHCFQAIWRLNSLQQWQLSLCYWICDLGCAFWGQLVCVPLSIIKVTCRLKGWNHLKSPSSPAWHLMLAVDLDLCLGCGQNSFTSAFHVAACLPQCDDWVPRASVLRERVKRKLRYPLWFSLEIMQCHFCHILLVKID